MLALEGIEPSSALNVNVCFGFLWGTYLFVFAAIIANVVMKSHFEPQPLIPRVKRHLGLIMMSAGALFATLLVIAVPGYLLQRNVTMLVESVVSGNADVRPQRKEWLEAAAPVIIGLLAWQAEVVYSTRSTLYAWWHENTPRARGSFVMNVYYVGAHCTPLFFILALLSAVEATVNPESTIHRAVGSAPLFVVFATLAVVFLMEFSVHRRLNDLLYALCLVSASFFPISIVVLPLRGLTALPLVLACCGFYLVHLNEMRRQMTMWETGVPIDEEVDDVAIQ